MTEIWILLFWAGCDSWGVIYWYKLKGPISYTIRLCERNMHLLILKCTGFRGQGVCWAAWWAQCYNTPVPHVCACCPQPGTKQPPLQKFSVKHSCVSQLFTTCFQNWALYFLLWDKQTKSYQAAYKFPRYKLSALPRCVAVLLAYLFEQGWDEVSGTETRQGISPRS